MKRLIKFVALISLLVLQPAFASHTEDSEPRIRALDLKEFKYFGQLQKCIVLSVHNKTKKDLSFPVESLITNLVSEPYYTYEIKVTSSKDWVAEALEIGTYQKPTIFRVIKPRQSTKLCVYFPSWSANSSAVTPGALIRLQIRDSLGQPHTTEVFSSAGEPKH